MNINNAIIIMVFKNCTKINCTIISNSNRNYVEVMLADLFVLTIFVLKFLLKLLNEMTSLITTDVCY